MNTAILIPAYEPDEKLVHLVEALSTMHFPLIQVVNDGSSEKCTDIFRSLEQIPNCTVVNHKVNRGKGAALKTGFKSIFNMEPDLLGCITVDADGQHLPEDILKVTEVFEQKRDTLVLGCRDFGSKDVPFKSKFGNLITRSVYKLGTGKSISDTQTGLRAIPMKLMKNFIGLPGNHYELEMNMLMYTANYNVPVKEVIITTVYIDENSSSHFNPFIDSVRIYKVIFKNIRYSTLKRRFRHEKHTQISH